MFLPVGLLHAVKPGLPRAYYTDGSRRLQWPHCRARPGRTAQMVEPQGNGFKEEKLLVGEMSEEQV